MSDDDTTRMLKRGIAEAEAVLLKFSADMLRDSANAFERSIGAFEAAATRRVLASVLRMLGDGVTRADVQAKAQREVEMRAKRGSRSTSETANLMEAETMSAWVRVLDVLRIANGLA